MSEKQGNKTPKSDSKMSPKTADEAQSESPVNITPNTGRIKRVATHSTGQTRRIARRAKRENKGYTPIIYRTNIPGPNNPLFDVEGAFCKGDSPRKGTNVWPNTYIPRKFINNEQLFWACTWYQRFYKKNFANYKLRKWDWEFIFDAHNYAYYNPTQTQRYPVFCETWEDYLCSLKKHFNWFSAVFDDTKEINDPFVEYKAFHATGYPGFDPDIPTSSTSVKMEEQMPPDMGHTSTSFVNDEQQSMSQFPSVSTSVKNEQSDMSLEPSSESTSHVGFSIIPQPPCKGNIQTLVNWIMDHLPGLFPSSMRLYNLFNNVLHLDTIEKYIATASSNPAAWTDKCESWSTYMDNIKSIVDLVIIYKFLVHRDHLQEEGHITWGKTYAEFMDFRQSTYDETFAQYKVDNNYNSQSWATYTPGVKTPSVASFQNYPTGKSKDSTHVPPAYRKVSPIVERFNAAEAMEPKAKAYIPHAPTMVSTGGGTFNKPYGNQKYEHVKSTNTKHIASIPEAITVHGTASFDSQRSQHTRNHTMKVEMNKPARARSIIPARIKWTGTRDTFDVYRREIEGFLNQAGVGYLIRRNFLHQYELKGAAYIETENFYMEYLISLPQARMDRSYLYGILQTSVHNGRNQFLTKHSSTGDGIAVWIDYLKTYVNKGSNQLQVEELERQLSVPFNPTRTKLNDYLENFETLAGELEAVYAEMRDAGNVDAIFPTSRKRQLLLTNVSGYESIQQTVMGLRRDQTLSYQDIVTALTQTAIYLEALPSKPSSRHRVLNTNSDFPNLEDSQPQQPVNYITALGMFSQYRANIGFRAAYAKFSDSKERL